MHRQTTLPTIVLTVHSHVSEIPSCRKLRKPFYQTYKGPINPFNQRVQPLAKDAPWRGDGRRCPGHRPSAWRWGGDGPLRWPTWGTSCPCCGRCRGQCPSTCSRRRLPARWNNAADNIHVILWKHFISWGRNFVVWKRRTYSRVLDFVDCPTYEIKNCLLSWRHAWRYWTPAVNGHIINVWQTDQQRILACQLQ